MLGAPCFWNSQLDPNLRVAIGLRLAGSPRLPLNGAFKGDIDIGVDVDLDIMI